MIHERTWCRDETDNHKLPVAAGFWITEMVSKEECWSLTQNLMQIRCSTCSVILNVTTTQYTCSLSGVYHPHWLVQWSCHCSHMRIPVHSPQWPHHINVTQTVLVVLTMAELFSREASYTMKLILITHPPYKSRVLSTYYLYLHYPHGECMKVLEWLVQVFSVQSCLNHGEEDTTAFQRHWCVQVLSTSLSYRSKTELSPFYFLL